MNFLLIHFLISFQIIIFHLIYLNIPLLLLLLQKHIQLLNFLIHIFDLNIHINVVPLFQLVFYFVHIYNYKLILIYIYYLLNLIIDLLINCDNSLFLFHFLASLIKIIFHFYFVGFYYYLLINFFLLNIFLDLLNYLFLNLLSLNYSFFLDLKF